MRHSATRHRRRGVGPLAALVLGAALLAGLAADATAIADSRTPPSVEELRSALAAAGHGGDAPTRALDLLEAQLVLLPARDGSDLFAVFGRGTSGAPMPPVDVDAFAIAAAPIPGDDDGARARARDQRQRGTVLLTIATARGLALPASVRFGDGGAEALLSDVESVAPHHRVAFLLSSATLADRDGRDPNRAIDLLIARPDIRPIDRTAAKALRALLESRRRGGSCEELVALQSAVRRTTPLEQLLVADALALCRTGSEATAWCDLYDLCDEPTRLALRGPLLDRLRSTPLPRNASATKAPDAARDLHVLAHADELRAADPAALESRCSMIERRAEAAACRPLALFELGRGQSLAKRYAESATTFLRLVNDYPLDPLAASAIDVAVIVREELYRASSDPRLADALRDSLRDALRPALAHFPHHPQRLHWHLLEAELALACGDADVALAAADAFTPERPEWGSVRIMAAEAALDPRWTASDGDRIARADRELAATATLTLTPELAARRSLVAATRDLLAGSIDRAAAAAGAIAENPAAPLPLRAKGLLTLFLTLDRREQPIALPPLAEEAIRADPAAWWPWLRIRLLGDAAQVRAITDDAAATAFARRRLRTLLPLLLDVAARDGDAPSRVTLAEAAMRAGLLGLVDRIFPADEERTVPALLVRADAKRLAGDRGSREASMRLFRAVTDAVQERSAEWWRAELGQLRVAAAEGTPESVVAVRARIHWLRGIDGTLGGGAVGPAIEALLRSLPDR